MTAGTPSSEFQHAGLSTMSDEIEKADHYYDWLFDTLSPELGSSVLEVGPGFGNLAKLIMRSARRYAGVDLDPEIIERLRKKFANDERSRFLVCDIGDSGRLAELRALQADTVLSTHVLEHIQDPHTHLVHLAAAVPGGRLVVLVPAFPALYGRWDEEAGHYCRYTRAGLKALLEGAGVRDLRLRYFDAAALPGLWLVSKVLRRALNADSSNSSIKIFDRWVLPWARHLDPLFRDIAGVSLIAVGRLPEKA